VPLRKRISLVAAAAVAIAVALACVISYAVVRGQLLSQIDSELTQQAQTLQTDPVHSLSALPTIPASAGGPAPYEQIVTADRQVYNKVLPNGEALNISGLKLPGVAVAAEVAAERAPAFMSNVTVNGTTLRMYTFPMTGFNVGGISAAVQLARPLAPVEHVLSTLRLILLLVLIAGIAIAAMLGRVAASRVLAPLAEMTATTELIGKTDDLSRRLTIHTEDEVGQLAERFNEMLSRLEASRDELDESVHQQRQLVADASHELRTPVTSLRTNAEVLLAGADLDADDRRRLLTDVVEQTAELSTLVSDLIEVARGEETPDATEEIRLDQLVEDALHRARRDAPAVEFFSRLHPVVVEGSWERLSRAINNLLDNAARHSGGARVEIDVDEASGAEHQIEVRVRDHGGGIDETDLPHVFDRFYRGAKSRSLQGSGLGLAIVRSVAEQHKGTVTAANAPDGGAVFTLALPGLAAASFDDERELPIYEPGDGGLTGGLTSRA
jgi:two-component system, OmpR family, sensor histidine kinase MprB